MSQNSGLPQHISKQFDRDLEHIRDRILAMGGIVELQLRNGIASLSQQDAQLARNAIHAKKQANQLEVSLDEECMKLLIRRQPAAGDMRLMMAIIKAITDLERIGDEAEKIAKMSKKLIAAYSQESFYANVISMGEYVCEMVHDALDAFARMSSADAIEVASREPESDDQYAAIIKQLHEHIQRDRDSINVAINAMWLVRAMERVGDHARNICEYVIYSVEGEDVRHITIKQMKKRIGYGHADTPPDPPPP